MKFFRVFFLFILVAFSSIFGNQKVVLFNDTSNWYHWGCTGTSTALKEGIEKLGFEIEAIPINVTYALREVPQFEEFNDRQKFDRFCEENKETVVAIQGVGAVVITGEGTIHDLRAGPRALLYLAHISREFFGKHVEIINHSAYPKDDPALSTCFLENFGVEKERAEKELKEAEEVYKRAYSKLDFVAIREPLSRDIMKKIGISSILTFDCLPLYIRDHYNNPKQIEEKTVVVAGSVVFTDDGAEKICRYLETMHERGFRIKVLVGAAAFPAKDDQIFANFLKEHCKAPWDLVVASSMEQWLDTINQATLLVSGRFHHSIAAFCLNTPFIALNSNTHKVHAICSFLGQPEPLLFSEPELFTQLLSQTESILSSPVVNNEIKVAEICGLAERNFDGLKSFVVGKEISCSSQDLLSGHDQMLVVLSNGWEEKQGSLQRYERVNDDAAWSCVGDPISVVLGEAGLAWGIGLHPELDPILDCKKEGDRKSPAGIFSLGSAFGFGSSFDLKTDYFQLNPYIEAVDDPNSFYYNCIVDRREVVCDWNSSEQMGGEPLYRLGMIVNHNFPKIERGKGSAIFLHAWRGEGEGTAGCTAMSLENLNVVLSWLDKNKSPVLVQLTKEKYDELQNLWGLPSKKNG